MGGNWGTVGCGPGVGDGACGRVADVACRLLAGALDSGSLRPLVEGGRH